MMRRFRTNIFLLLILFSFLLLLVMGCFAANIFNPKKNLATKQPIENTPLYQTRLESGQVVRDYTKLSQSLDQEIKNTLGKSQVPLNNITKIEDKKMSRKVGLEWLDKVEWQYWEERIDASPSSVALPEIALRLETQLKKDQGRVLKSIWEENAKAKTLTMQVGFDIKNGTKVIPIATHTIRLQQDVRANSSRGKIALIIDDFGAMMPGTKEMMALKIPLTFSVLPYRATTKEEAKMAADRGFEVMLHLSMEPINPKVSAGPGAIKTGMTSNQVKELFNKALAQVPQAKGSNNHMGSKATQDRGIMTAVLEEIKKDNLYFVDSHTSPKSVTSQVAKELGVPSLENYLFIDNVDKEEAIKKEIRDLAKIALTQGQVVGIGHVRVATAQAIKDMVPELEKQGISLVYISQLLKK